MGIDKKVTLNFNNGTSYKLLFFEFKLNSLPIEIKIPTVDITLESSNNKLQPTINNLISIAETIKAFLLENDVILYYYCDRSPITYRKNRIISPQAYRSQLFHTLFLRLESPNIIKEATIISDSDNENHYITIISTLKNMGELNRISQELQKLQK